MEKKKKRWTATRKMEIVLRLMRGESREELSREIGVPASCLEQWHRAALSGIESSLKSRVDDPLEDSLNLAKKRIGELSMENELLREKNQRKSVFLGGKWKR